MLWGICAPKRKLGLIFFRGKAYYQKTMTSGRLKLVHCSFFYRIVKEKREGEKKGERDREREPEETGTFVTRLRNFCNTKRALF